MRGLNILKQSGKEPDKLNKPNPKFQVLKTNIGSDLPAQYDNLFNNLEERKNNFDLTNRDYISGYENPETYAGGVGLDEIRAYNQSNLAKTASGIGRIGTKAVTEVLKMPGVIGGMITAP